MRDISRRELGLGTAAMLFAGTLPQSRGAQGAGAKTRIILLGTGGGPTPRKTRVPSSQVVLINERAYVFDCGVGVTTQLARAGVRLGYATFSSLITTPTTMPNMAPCCSPHGGLDCELLSIRGGRPRLRE